MKKIRNSKKGILELFSMLHGQTVIAVAGTMAAGKNYVCSLLEKDGWESVDADQLVHQAIANKTEVIKETFEAAANSKDIQLVNPDGSINRRELGKLVFSNPDLLAKQEAIVYPEVTELARSFIQNHSKSIINATVLYKTPQLLNLCSSVIFVTAPLPKRFYRALKRDHLPPKQILHRFKAQKNLLKEYTNQSKNFPPVILVKN